MQARKTNGDNKNGAAKRDPLYVDLLDDDGQPTPFLLNAPFLDYHSPMTALERMKVVFLAPLAIARLLVSIVGVVLAWLIILFTLLGQHPTEPLPKWKEVVSRSTLKVTARVVLWVCAGGKVTVEGWENFNEGHTPLIFNHVSYIDALVLVAYFAPCGVAKAGVATLPLIGTITRGLQFLFVARSGTTDKVNKYTIQGDVRAQVAAREVDPRYPNFMIAPEGTTKPGHCLLRFSVGGFAPGVAVQPILLDYSENKRFNPGWGLDESTIWHIWRVFTQLRTHIRLKVLPVYHPSEEDPKLYAENVRRLMGQHLNAPLVDYGTREEFLLKTAGVYIDMSGRNLCLRKPGMAKPVLLARLDKLPASRE